VRSTVTACLQNFQVIKLTALFCSYQHKYKHPEHGSKAKEHKACIMQRITKDDGADEFDAEFSISYPHPFSVYWYNGPEGDARLLSARDARKRAQDQDAGGASGSAGAGAGAEQLKIPGTQCPPVLLSLQCQLLISSCSHGGL